MQILLSVILIIYQRNRFSKLIMKAKYFIRSKIIVGWYFLFKFS